MNNADILKNAVTEEEYSLGELQQWLKYGKHTWSLGIGVFWLTYQLIFLAFKIIAFLFTPYMIYHLYKANWYKSVATLCLVVVLPYFASLLFDIENSTFEFLFSIFPFLALYIYIYIISYFIDERLDEIQTLRRWERESA